MAGDKKQQLHGSNRSVNIAEALSARVKDPLWFLARQWQTGEFEAENGGALASVDLESRHFPVARLQRGAEMLALDPKEPLEPFIEAESAGRDEAAAWRSEALEYAFGLETSGHRLRASDYTGFQLDWYQFDLEKSFGGDGAEEDAPRSYVPTQISLPGAPDPRWWRLEEAGAYFDAPREAEPNILSTLLPEFFYTDINNWYMIPAPMPTGAVRDILSLRVTDSFGVMTELEPVEEEGWRVFAVDPLPDAERGISGRQLYAPNIAIDVLYNDVLEDVRFVRDEQANLVWAWEHVYTTETGETVMNGDAREAEAQGSGDAPEPAGFRLMSDVPRNWIPYLPVQIDLTPTDGEVFLRRGRTDPEASRDTPQYRSTVVAEAVRLMEEEVPRTGLRVRRIAKFASGAGEDSNHFWVGRHKDAGRGHAGPGLRFDYVEGDD
ncbi:MAG: hypothetical protein RID11_00965 [Roseovarius sp.]|uniref:hypothetical protein n=1 Tax=Roseovarius sp. TaxID=1486281 RepID=UPI0032EC2093